MEDPFGLRILNPLHLIRLLWHLPDFIKLFWRLFLDSRVSLYLKLLVIGSILYVISPVDFLPEFLLPFIGSLDDLIILIVAGKLFLTCSPKHVVMEHVARIDREKQLKREMK